MARRYSEEFKQGAVRLYRESGLGYRQIAADLGISAYALRQWVQRAGEGGAVAASSESEELQRLRRENRILREEREILRKAAVGSRGERNSDFGQHSSGGSEAQRLAGACVQLQGDSVQFSL